MQSATQYHDAPPAHPARGPDLPDFPSLGFDTDIYNPFLCETLPTGGYAWDGSFGDGTEYVALEALANSGATSRVPTQPDPQALTLPAPFTGSTNVDTVYISGFDQAISVPAHLPPTQGIDALWNDFDSTLFPLSGAPNDWGDLIGTPFLFAADPAGCPTTASYELHQGSYELPHGTIGTYEAQYDAYEAHSSSGTSSSASSPATSLDRSSIFSPEVSQSSLSTTSTAPSTSVSSPALSSTVSPSQASKKPARTKATRGGRVRSSASLPAKPAHSTSLFPSGHVRATAPRNKQIPLAEIKEPVLRGNKWSCSHCSYQTSRKLDMPRHMETHSKPASNEAEFICCGLPLEDVPGYTGEIRYHEGRAMAGGCVKTFSRKDSLLRHLRLREGRCIRPAYLTSS